ncbi:MAG: sugar phosphate isomerase/epimerase [Candidatus Omnitrophica bacterium]|nr:sugar phosphate isomerase/epimerase [Candidatus Omnitrophota bacterium]
MGIALSTSWNAFRYEDAKKLLFEIREVGFDEIELSFNLTANMVSEIECLVKDGLINIVSLHNYCPIPEGLKREEALPDIFNMASLNEEERSLAVKFSKRTIDTAKNTGAKAVVLHCGRVEIPDATKQLIELYDKGLKDSPEFLKLKNNALVERKQRAGRFLENSIKSLDELNSYAKMQGIFLGIETRFYFREIPSLEELDIILKKFRGSQVFYWHDSGHAQVMEELGFNKHSEFLSAGAKSIIGVHLHDVIGCSDHKAPLKGMINFDLLKGYLKKETLKVIEAHHPATISDLRQAKDFLEDKFKHAL